MKLSLTRFENVKDRLAEINEEAILFDGYEQALIGICERFGASAVACYDYDLCLKVLMKRDGMDRDEAQEFFEFNTLGCYAGEHTPVFVNLFT